MSDGMSSVSSFVWSRRDRSCHRPSTDVSLDVSRITQIGRLCRGARHGQLRAERLSVFHFYFAKEVRRRLGMGWWDDGGNKCRIQGCGCCGTMLIVR